MNDHHPLSCPLAELLAGRPPAAPAPLGTDDVERIAARVVQLLSSPGPTTPWDAPGGPGDVLGKVWFGVADAAAYTGRGRRTITRAIHAGELESDQRGRPGARHAIHREELDRWLRGQ